MTGTEIGGRFAKIRADVGEKTPKSMSLKVGIGENAWRLYEKGTGTPGWATLQKLAELGYSPSWLMTGEGEMHLTSSGQPTTGVGGVSIDEELLGRVTDAISRLYKDERISLAPIDLGRLAGRKYAEIIAATDDPAERLAMLKLITVQLRAELHASAVEPGTGKRSAS